MKKINLILISSILCFCVSAQDSITFEWEAGTDEKKFMVYFNSYCDGFSVNWGDDSNIDTYNLVVNGINPSHSYDSAGTYTVSIIASTVNCRISRLYCSNTQIKSLNVSEATALTNLDCSNNPLKHLDLSANKELVILECSDNPQLENLLLSQNGSLEILYIENCTALEELECSYNKIRVFWANGCTTLKRLVCSHNRLENYRFDFGPALEYLDCSYNPITSFPFAPTTLKTLYCNNSGNGARVFLQEILSSPCLDTIDCSFNQMYNIDLSNNPKLKYLKCNNSYLSNLDLSNNVELQNLYCNDNYINNLNLTNNQDLTKIACYNNSLQLSNLYDISEMINDENNKLLGTQSMVIPSTIIGDTLFTDQSEFNGNFTNYIVLFPPEHLDPNWYPAPESSYSVINGKIIFNNIGYYYVELTNDAIVSHYDYPAKTISYITITSNVGINENSISDIQIYPNPTNGVFRVPTVNFRARNIQIFDVSGKIVWRDEGKREAGAPIEMDISHLLAGTYFVKINTDIGEVVKKVEKK